MPLSPLITFYAPDGKPLPGPIPVADPDTPGLTGCYCEEFQHCVYTVQKDYFYALLYGVDFVRIHEPLTIVKQLDKMSVPLMKFLVNGTFLQKVEIRWLQYNEKRGKTEEYFRMTLEHVRIHSIKSRLPDVKERAFERYGHLEEIQLIYQKITWLYTKGTILHTDIWDDAFGEFDRKDFSEKADASEDDITGAPLIEPLRLEFIEGRFEEPQDGFQFDKKATVRFTFETNRKPDNKENKVYAKLFALYNDKTEDMGQINEGRLINGADWSTEFRLKKPALFEKDTNRAPDATVGYYAVIENGYATNNNFKSDSIAVPSSKNVVIDFSDEDNDAFSDFSFQLNAGEEVAVRNGSTSLSPESDELEILFNNIAMNVQTGNSARNG